MATPMRILVVEDDEDLADTLQMYLKQCGHTVRVACSPFSAVLAVEEFVPAIVLLDVGLPGMIGYELARALRHKPALASMQLIAITAMDGQRERLLKEGFVEHLRKPFSLARLGEVLAEFG